MPLKSESQAHALVVNIGDKSGVVEVARMFKFIVPKRKGLHEYSGFEQYIEGDSQS